MTTRTPKTPSSEHPITIAPASQRVEVRVGEKLIASTEAALELRESTYPPVYYIPRGDVDQSVLRPSDTETYCPYKGEASYASVDLGTQVVEDALWFYADPYDAVADIKDHVAFYPDRVELTVA